MPEDYSKIFTSQVSPKLVFKAITEEIDLWWTTASNRAKVVDDELRVEFGMETFKVMKVIQSDPDKSLTWEVKDAYIGHKKITKKDEWVGTKIQWVIHPIDNGSQVEFLHQGLMSKMECWDACSNGWDYFLDSLKGFLDSGKGTPFKYEKV